MLRDTNGSAKAPAPQGRGRITKIVLRHSGRRRTSPAGARRGKAKVLVAHQDDEAHVELPAYGFSDDLEEELRGASISATVVADGLGAPQKAVGDNHLGRDELWRTRRRESIKAAKKAGLSEITFLDYPSDVLRDVRIGQPTFDIQEDLTDGKDPYDALFTHSCFDRHPTHRSIFERAVKACLMMPPEQRPRVLLAGEVWCDHEWVAEAWRVRFDISAGLRLARRVLRCFPSQTEVRPYHIGAAARWIAHAVYEDTHGVQNTRAVAYALNMTPLIQDPPMSLAEYIANVLAQSMFFDYPLLGVSSDDIRQAFSPMTFGSNFNSTVARRKNHAGNHLLQHRGRRSPSGNGHHRLASR